MRNVHQCSNRGSLHNSSSTISWPQAKTDLPNKEMCRLGISAAKYSFDNEMKRALRPRCCAVVQERNIENGNFFPWFFEAFSCKLTSETGRESDISCLAGRYCERWSGTLHRRHVLSTFVPCQWPSCASSARLDCFHARVSKTKKTAWCIHHAENDEEGIGVERIVF